MKKRIFAMLLAVCLAICWLPVAVHAEAYAASRSVDVNFLLTPDAGEIWLTLPVAEGDCFNQWYDELPEPPEREGFLFDGWSQSPSKFVPFDTDVEIWPLSSQGLYVYGFWSEDTSFSCTVTFLVDDQVYAEITAENGLIADMPEIPESQDRIFKQWQTEDGLPFEGFTEEDLTLHACWYDSVITYDPNGQLDTDFELRQFGADNGDTTPDYGPDPELESHIFLGWDPQVSETVDGSVTYTAIWEPRPQKTFTLTYDANADNDPTVSGMPTENPVSFTTYHMEMEYCEFPDAPVLTRTGFLFAHWNTEPDDSGEIVAPGDSFTVDGDGILYAIWERKTCQVSFDGFESTPCLWGETISQFPTGEQLGLNEGGYREEDGKLYRFDGWYTGRSGTGESFTEETPVEGDLTLYLHWIPQVEITFQIQNGTWQESGSDTCVFLLDKGSALKPVIPTPVPEADFWETGRWNADPALASAYEPTTFLFTCNAREKVAVTFRDGESTETREIIQGNPLGALPVPVHPGWTFLGWYNGETAVTEDMIVETDLTLEARWQKPCTITFQNGESAETREIMPGSPIGTLPTPTRPGWNFLGWYNGETAVTEEMMVETDLILEARWQKLCIVTFQNGESIETREITPGSPIGALPTPTRPGWNFLGWYNGETAVTEEMMVETDLTLEARWQKLCIVTFQNGESAETREIMPGSPIGALPTPTRPGWTFLGWYHGEAAVTEKYIVETDLTLDAHWQKLVTLTFDANGGANPPKPITGAGPFTIPVPHLTRYGYQFLGWSTDREAERPEFKQDDVYAPAGDSTLYAVWSPEEYTITYNDGVRTSVIFEDVVYTAAFGEETPAFSGKPTRKGYSFKGWKPVVSETVAGNALYEAQWAKVDKTNPKTGDSIALWSTILLLSAVSMMGAIALKRKP